MQYTNGTQKFLYEKFSYVTTTKYGKSTILSIWLIYIAVSIWGASKVDIDFKNTYFIGEDANVRDYLERQEEYYKSGETINIIVDNEEADFTSEES